MVIPYVESFQTRQRASLSIFGNPPEIVVKTGSGACAVSPRAGAGASDRFLEALSTSLGIPRDVIVQTITTGSNEQRGTWVHPQVAINLAQWVSPEFAVQVSQWVYDWMSGNNRPGAANIPYHLQRYLMNSEQVPAGYFSILAELSIMLIAPLEKAGYRLPPEMVPDISSGRIFCKWLRDEKGLDTDSLPVYFHRYPDGRTVPAKLYPEDLLADFRRHVREIWIPKHSVDYFRARDGAALQYLPKLLPSAAMPSQPQKGFGFGRKRKSVS